MTSKQYHLSFLAKEKANLRNQIRRRKQSDHQSEDSGLIKYANDQKVDTYVSIKTQMLGRKLKKKDKQSTMQFSRLTFLKQSRSLNGLKVIGTEQILSVLRQQNDRLMEENQASLGFFEQFLLKMTQKHRQSMEKFNHLKNQNSVQLSQFLKLIDQLQERSKSYELNRYNCNMYCDILSRNKKERNQIIQKLYSKRSTINQSYKQGNLLQSFKRNLEEDDGYVTLKYSQQSNRKERSQPNQTLAEGWDSFRKDNMKNTLFKSANKGQIQKIEVQEDQFSAVKDTLVQHLYFQKEYLMNEHDQSEKILQQFEGVLQKIIQQVAYEKVEQDQLLKSFEKLNKQDVIQLSCVVSKLKMDQMAQRFRFDQKIKQIQESVQDHLAQQKQARKNEEKSMIKMMIEVVEFFD